VKRTTLTVLVLATATFAVVFLLVRPWKQPSNTISIGATFPLTGEVASYGQKAKRGIDIAVEDQRARGGLLGRQVIVDFQDDRNDKREAVSIMTRFATIDKVPVVLGSAGSTVSLAIVPLANRYKVLLISPISSSTKLSTQGGEYFFRTCPADDLQAQILASWVYETGARRVAIVYTNNSWGAPLAEASQRHFELLGGKVLLSEGVQENSTDFRTIITKLKALTSLDAVISPTYPKEGGVFVRQAKELRLKCALFGGDNWGSPEFREIVGKAAEGVLYTSPAQGSSSSFRDFAQKYKAKYGEEP
jgi:branched-chain amino acid transport system substrate-binding protein